jgi:hypothetical protein
MGARDLRLEGAGLTLERLLHERGDYAHVHVQARAGHLLVKAQDSQGAQVPIARATPLGGGQYGLSFRTHQGRWEPMPVSGALPDIAQALTEMLGAYLDRENLG